jgi:hypothetical protein
MPNELQSWAKRKVRAGRHRKAGGGEGSRGGKVIGHTKSGKPIYAPHDGHEDAHSADLPHRGQSFAAEHGSGYSKGEHFEASKALMGEAKKARSEGKTALAYHLGAVSAGHKQLARGEDAYGAKVKKGQN